MFEVTLKFVALIIIKFPVLLYTIVETLFVLVPLKLNVPHVYPTVRLKKQNIAIPAVVFELLAVKFRNEPLTFICPPPKAIKAAALTGIVRFTYSVQFITVSGVKPLKLETAN